MCLHLKNICETDWYLVGDRWSNDRSDNMIVLIIDVVFLIVDDHVVQDNINMHDQPDSTLRVRSVSDG
jgi:hypothetical protein